MGYVYQNCILLLWKSSLLVFSQISVDTIHEIVWPLYFYVLYSLLSVQYD